MQRLLILTTIVLWTYPLNGEEKTTHDPSIQKSLLTVQREATVIRSGIRYSLEIEVPVWKRMGAIWVSAQKEQEITALLKEVEQYVKEARELADRADKIAIHWERITSIDKPLHQP